MKKNFLFPSGNKKFSKGIVFLLQKTEYFFDDLSSLLFGIVFFKRMIFYYGQSVHLVDCAVYVMSGVYDAFHLLFCECVEKRAYFIA